MKVIDLFCGCGGFSEGFRQAGHEIVLAVDNWETALKSHETNHPHTEHWLRDILTITPEELPPADIIVGGPPCQSFSYMGKRDGLGQSFINKFIQLSKGYQYRLFENVTGIQQYPILGDVCRELDLEWQILNYADYGIATERERIFASNWGFPQQTHFKEKPLTAHFDKKTERWMSAKECLAVDDEMFFMRRYTEGRNGTPGRSINRPYYTILSSNEAYLCRKLTSNELAQLQGFPSGYQFIGSESAIIKQLANSVSPIIAKKFAEMLP